MNPTSHLFHNNTRALEVMNALSLSALGVYFLNNPIAIVIHNMPPFFAGGLMTILALLIGVNALDSGNETLQGGLMIIASLVWCLLSACMVFDYPPVNIALVLFIPFSLMSLSCGVFLIEVNRT